MNEERLWRDLIMERVTKSADACLTALHVMTSPRMPQAVYLEDVIERVVQFTKFHLQNTLYPQYDAAYRMDARGGKLRVTLFYPIRNLCTWKPLKHIASSLVRHTAELGHVYYIRSRTCRIVLNVNTFRVTLPVPNIPVDCYP